MSNRKPRFEEILTVGRSYGRLSEAPGLWKGNVGLWSFAEGGGGKVYDVSGRGNNGTLINGPIWVPDGIDLPTSATDYIEGSGFNTAGWSGISLCIWVNIATPFRQRLMTLSGAGDTSWEHVIQYWNDALEVGINESGSAIQTTGLPLNADTWYNIVLTATAGTANNVKTYVDAALISTLSTSFTTLNATDRFQFGKLSQYTLSGFKIGFACVYSRSLSASEIQQLYEDPYAMLRLRPRTIGLPTAAPVVSTRGGILHRGQVPGILSRAG